MLRVVKGLSGETALEVKEVGARIRWSKIIDFYINLIARIAIVDFESRGEINAENYNKFSSLLCKWLGIGSWSHIADYFYLRTKSNFVDLSGGG